LGRFNILARNDGGSALEMGVLLPLFLILTSGTVDVGIQIMSTMAVNHAAQAGAAYILMNPADIVSGGGGLAAAMTSATGLVVQATPAPTLVDGVLTITATTPYAAIIPWSTEPTAITQVITMRIE
jgi:Flp pilus assembly protein TadG